MKNLLLIFSVLLSTSLTAVEYGYLYFSDGGETAEIELNAGDVFEVTNFQNKFNLVPNELYNILSFNLPNGDTEQLSVRIPYKRSISDAIGSLPDSNIIIYGPTYVYLSSGWLSYKLTRASEYQNSNVFSVIGGPSSTHNIAVETSTDLENWTPVHSSGLTGSSEQIYVRTRISTSE